MRVTWAIVFGGGARITHYIFQFDQSWERLSAAAVLVTIPALIVFMSAQRYLVSGLSRGAVKG